MSFRRFCPDSGSTRRIGFIRKLREYFAVERWVRLPRLRRDHPSVTNGLLIDEDPAGLLGFPANVLVAGHAFSARQAGRRQDLDAVADAEDPLRLPIELAQDLDDFAVIAKILRRTAT